MKQAIAISAISLFLISGCGESKPSTDSFITVDVRANYPKKELILQDFMDVEYIPLETNDEFVCQGLVEDIGKEIIVVRNHNHVWDGNIFLFDRTGKGIKKMNRKGEGGEEYTVTFGITLDEDKGEIFVNDLWRRKIIVYDLNGVFKRSFSHVDGTGFHNIYNFGRENFICYDPPKRDERQSFFVVSKQDGSVVDEISIPYQEKKSTWLQYKDVASNMTYGMFCPGHYPIIANLENRILTEPSSDTLYSYFADHTMKPLIARTPSVHSMDPEVFLFPSVFTDRYYFMAAVKKEFDWDKNEGHPKTELVYDRQKNTLSEYVIYNADFTDKKPVDLVSGITVINNDEIAFLQNLSAFDLIEAYKNGQLKGRLKEIAATLDEEDNPVIMLVKHKK